MFIFDVELKVSIVYLELVVVVCKILYIVEVLVQVIGNEYSLLNFNYFDVIVGEIWL